MNKAQKRKALKKFPSKRLSLFLAILAINDGVYVLLELEKKVGCSCVCLCTTRGLRPANYTEDTLLRSHMHVDSIWRRTLARTNN